MRERKCKDINADAMPRDVLLETGEARGLVDLSCHMERHGRSEGVGSSIKH